MPSIRVVENGRRDLPLRRMSYNNMIDRLHKDGELSDRQAGSYIIPNDLVKDYRKQK
jgi:hypothetical protein